MSAPMTLTGVAPETLRLWLTQAQTALHSLMTGQRVVTVAYAQGDGQRTVTYRGADAPSLRVWIAEISLALAPCGPARRRPIYPRF